MQIGRVQVVGDDEQIDVGIPAGLAAGHRAEQPGTEDVRPAGKSFAEAANEFAAQTGESDQRAGGEVAPVQRHHRRSPGDELTDETAPDDVLDDRAGVTRRHPGCRRQLSSGDGLFEPRENLQQRATHRRRDVEKGRTQTHNTQCAPR